MLRPIVANAEQMTQKTESKLKMNPFHKAAPLPRKYDKTLEVRSRYALTNMIGISQYERIIKRNSCESQHRSVELLKHSEIMEKNVNSNIDSFIIYQELLFTIKKSIYVLLLLI